MAIIHNLIARFRADTGAFDRNVNKSRAQMTRFGRDVQRMGRQLLAIAGVGGGIYAVSRALKGMTRAAAIQERAEKDLRAAVGFNIKSLKEYAAVLQTQTVYGDEQILSQMAYAKNLGVTTDKLNEAAKAAIGLAAKFRLDLQTAMMLVGRASKGQTQMLTRYGIVLDSSLTDQGKFNALLKIGADNFKLAQAQAQDATGTWKQFKNAASDVAEILGGPVLDNTTKVLRKLIETNEYMKGGPIAGKGAGNKFPLMTPPKWFWELDEARRKPKIPEISKETQALRDYFAKTQRANELAKEKIEEQTRARTQAAEISEKYLMHVREEQALTGKVGEARQHAAQIIKLQNDLQKAGIKDTLAAKEAVTKLRNELNELSKVQKLGRIAADIGDAFASAFERMIFEAEKFRDVMRSVAREVGVSVFRNLITQPIANQITMALGGNVPATVGHSGGVFGQIGRKRNVNPFMFANAPRLHNGGLMPDEMPAIVQRGERVIPKGQNPFGVTIINESGDRNQIRPTIEPMFDGKKLIIRVVAEDINSGGTLRKIITGVR